MGQLSTKAESRETFVPVIVLHNLSHCLDGCHVLVWPTGWVPVVQGAGVAGGAIGPGKANSDCKINLGSSPDIVKKRRAQC